MPVKFTLTVLQQWIVDYFSLNTLAIVLITFGIITFVLTASYYLSFKSAESKSASIKRTGEILIAVIIITGLELIKKLLPLIPNSGISDIYRANSAIVLLLIVLFSARQRSVNIVNYVAPPLLLLLEIYPVRSLKVSFLFTIINLAFVGFIYFISHHKATIINKYSYYLLVQIVFGLVWWINIWGIYTFDLYKIPLMVIELVGYMLIIRSYQVTITKFARNYEYMSDEINIDPLTQVRNRLSFNNVAAKLFKRYSNTGFSLDATPISMAMLDIDHFKKFNDTYGHVAGDEVLKHVASNFKNELLKFDSTSQVFRFGGEEFIIIFRGSNSEQAAQILKQIQRSTAENPLRLDGKSLPVTVSAGVSQLKPGDQDFDDFFERVDRYMYKSKNTGNNYLTVENKVSKVDL